MIMIMIILGVTVLRHLNPRKLKLFFQNDSDALHNFFKHISLICDKSVTTQNLSFLSYWYRKKRLQMHFSQV